MPLPALRGLRPLVVLALLAGCEPEPAPPAPPAADAARPPRDAPRRGAGPAAPARDPVAIRAEADSVAARFVRALNDGDAAAVARLTGYPNEPPDTARAAAALRDFRFVFEGRPVARAERARTEGWSDPNHHLYELSTAEGARKPVVVVYDAVAGSFAVRDELTLFSRYAHGLAAAVVEAIRREDAERLARLLSPDDIDYPPALARQAIAAYRQRFDLPGLRLRFDGLAPARADGGLPTQRPFVFTVHGARDGRTVTHTVRVGHGDGLVWWDDPLVPVYSGD